MWTTPSPLKSPYSALNGPSMMLTSWTSSGLMLFSDPRYPCPCPCVDLVLWNVVHQNLQPAIHTAMVEVESEPADLERLPAALVLARIDAGSSTWKIWSSREKSVLEKTSDGLVSTVASPSDGVAVTVMLV